MSLLGHLDFQAQRLLVGGCPPALVPQLVVEAAQQAGGRGVMVIALDDAEAAALQAQLAFYAPSLTVHSLPAFDCLPYDRISPSAAVMAARAACLQALATPTIAPHVVLTTVNGITQLVPSPDVFAASDFMLQRGGTINRAQLQEFLTANGYGRTSTVREPGEYAMRGDIIDLYPPNSPAPVRVELFGDEIESLKQFDAATQLSTQPVAQLSLTRTTELALNAESCSRFRERYRALFGAQLQEDALYQAISAGRTYAGAEHWLPLFYESLCPLWHYRPQAAMMLCWQVAEALTARQAQVQDFYAAREALYATAKPKDKSAAYKPIPPALHYHFSLPEDNFIIELSPFAAGAAPPLATAAPDYTAARLQDHAALYAAFITDAKAAIAADRRVLLACYSQGSAERLVHVLQEHNAPPITQVADFAALQAVPAQHLALAILPLEQGMQTESLLLVTEQDLLGDRLARSARRKKAKRSDEFVLDLGALNPGDFVVHEEHGIGRFDGLITLEAAGQKHDCLRLVYANGDRLFLPVENLDLLSRYGNADASAALDKLGGAGWQQRKARVKKRLRDMAEQLMKIAAARELQTAPVAEPPSGLYDEFCARFAYVETEDQARAIDQVLEDLRQGKPMDRLVCGDVGFGKTEVALRAAFVAAAAGLQVAVVVPTTLLARQHFKNFARRFNGFALHVAQLSRFVPATDAKQVKADLASGKLDVVIGTHALLASGVQFARLGLVIVDEEQHFGVKQKEKLKDLQKNAHVLTLSATPIPRTLQLALTGVRELSLIATPPVDRLAVRTSVLPHDPLILKEALLREQFRGGQSFVVAPHIEHLAPLAEELRALVPELKIVTAHGQMTATELDNIMTEFDDGAFDVLLATNIIESGLDIPRANTMIIHRADMFGLAQLYQLRGRVGRAKQRGFAYLTYPAGALLTPSAEQRLKVMEMLDSLGAGFQLASHDLDLRGAGNMLGEEQSGHIKEVGIELYQQMLRDAVAAVRRGELVDMPVIEGWSPTLNLGLPVLLPETYVTDLGLRLSLYQRLAQVADAAAVEAFAAELIDRFGALPAPAQNLIATMHIKLACKRLGIERLDASAQGATITFRHNQFAAPEKLVAAIAASAGTWRVRPDMKLVVAKVWRDDAAIVAGVQAVLEQLLALVKQ